MINHHKQDVAEEIKRLTNRRGVDIVIEHVSEATWAKSVRSLARNGRLVTCGATYMGTKGDLLRAARFFFNGQLTPAVDRTYPLAEAAAAQRRLEESRHFGKIVLEVPA